MPAWKRVSAPTRPSSRRFERWPLLREKRAVGRDRCSWPGAESSRIAEASYDALSWPRRASGRDGWHLLLTRARSHQHEAVCTAPPASRCRAVSLEPFPPQVGGRLQGERTPFSFYVGRPVNEETPASVGAQADAGPPWTGLRPLLTRPRIGIYLASRVSRITTSIASSSLRPCLRMSVRQVSKLSASAIPARS